MKLPLCNFLHYPLTSSLLGPNVFFSILLSKILTKLSSLMC